jgi:HD-GYP domain-containing protein (c-di-GMP phosphodiesterase class II)
MEEIPLAARIFSVIDVWDALTSDRPYRAAWSREKTLQCVKDSSGIQFDPAVVTEFVKLIVNDSYFKGSTYSAVLPI